MTNERRRFPRIPTKIGAELIVEGKTYQADRIYDLSMGGCRLTLDETFDSDTECRVLIALKETPETLHVHLAGDIVRCGYNEVSVEFGKIDPKNLINLQNLLVYDCEEPVGTEDEFGDNRNTA